MRALVLPLAFILLAGVCCDDVANGRTLVDSMVHQLAAIPVVTSIYQKNDLVTIVYISTTYELQLTEVKVEPYDDPTYSHIGRIRYTTRSGTQTLDYFEGFRRAGIDPHDVVALWDAEKKIWNWQVHWVED